MARASPANLFRAIGSDARARRRFWRFRKFGSTFEKYIRDDQNREGLLGTVGGIAGDRLAGVFTTAEYLHAISPQHIPDCQTEEQSNLDQQIGHPAKSDGEGSY